MVEETSVEATAAARRGYQVQLFAKAPVPGRVKTRMQSQLSARQCAELHGRLLTYTLQRLHELPTVSVVLACGERHAFLEELAERYRVPIALQRGDDLGQRMRHAIETGLQRYPGVILVGGDCPFVDGSYLAEAVAALEAGADVVLGPAHDGGYVLVGARRAVPAMFDDVPWGSAEVMAVTRRRLQTAGCQWRELAPLPDIDRPEDLALLRRLPGFPVD